MKYHIAIVIPVFNAEKYIAECLDSIINQTYNDWEAICVNDGSTDASQNILLRYSQKDSRIKVLYQKNGGVSSARNLALKNITSSPSTWISFVDADDYISPSMYSDIVSALEDVNEASCDYVRLFATHTTNRPISSSNTSITGAGVKGCGVSHDACGGCGGGKYIDYHIVSKEEYFANGEVGGFVCSMFVRSTLIAENSITFPVDMHMMEDQVFSIKCAMQSELILVYRKRNYFIFQNPTSITRSCKNHNADIVRCIHYVYDILSVSNSSDIIKYLHTRYLPVKISSLINELLKWNSPLAVKLDQTIVPSHYISSFVTYMKYLYLRLRGHI